MAEAGWEDGAGQRDGGEGDAGVLGSVQVAARRALEAMTRQEGTGLWASLLRAEGLGTQGQSGRGQRAREQGGAGQASAGQNSAGRGGARLRLEAGWWEAQVLLRCFRGLC